MRHEACYTLSPRRRCGRIGIVVFALIGAFVAVAAIKTSRGARSSPPIGVSALSPARVPLGATPADTVATADTLLADVYPSRQSAVRALARRLPDAIDGVAERPATFRLNADDRSAAGALIRDAIRTRFPAATIASTAEPAGARAAAGEVVIDVRVDDQPAKSGRPATKGSVQLSVAGPARSTSLSVKFAQCDWADDLTSYINEHPGHNWIVVRSRKPGVTSTEARRSAEQSASAILARLVREQGLRSQPQAASPEAAHVLQLPITDRFVQRFHRTYGDVWEEAILLDVSPQWISAALQRDSAAVDANESRVRNTFASTGVVLLTILAAYAFSNVVTKRYFTGRLRAIAITTALAAVAVAVGIITVA